MSQGIHVVTGAFGFSGKYIARRLLERGHEVRTLTDSPDRKNEFNGKVTATRFNFEEVDALAESLAGVDVLYNTYWVRFNHREFKHSAAVANTLTLFEAAKFAGVKRIVHVSITNPSEESPLEYFASKAQLERELAESGISHAILRPTVLFGAEDILVNNIAWILRRLPVFGVFGKGDYRIQPIFVDDLAKLAVEHGESEEDEIINAIGPETFTYRELVTMIGEIIGKRRPIISVSPWAGHAVASMVGKWIGDVIVTREEIKGLMDDLLYVESPPTGTTKLSEWALEHRDTLGTHYASELARRKDRITSYQDL